MPVKGLEIITKFSGGTKPIWRLHGLFIERIAHHTAAAAHHCDPKGRFISCETHTIYNSVQRTYLHHCHFMDENYFLLSTRPRHRRTYLLGTFISY